MFSDSIKSFQHAVNLTPTEPKYAEALDGAKAALTHIQKKRKRKLIVTYSTGLIAIALIIGSVFLYKYVKENNAWKAAVSENTAISYQKYLKLYPGGTFFLEASSKIEDFTWEEAVKSYNPAALYNYLSVFPYGKYSDEANWIIAKAINNARGYLAYLTNSNSKKYLSIAKDELKSRDFLVNFSVGKQSYSKISMERIRINQKETIITIKLFDGGLLHEPNNDQAYIIKDKISNSILRIKSSNIEFEKIIPSGVRLIDLHFDKLPENIKYFDLIEGSCKSGCWNFYNIKVDPAGFEEKLHYQVGHQSRGMISIVNISNSLNYTIVSIKKENSGGIILPPNHNEAFYIKDDFTNKKYNLLGSSIGFNQSIVKNEVFDLIFEKIDNDTKQISVIEGDLPSNTGWHFTEIKLER